jgi:hypothetical protein
MRLVIATLLLASSMLSPLVAQATDDQVEATIAAISADGTTMSLDDGNTYVLPGEFDLEGLEEGTRVYVYFTEEDGQRRVFDLEVVN